MIDDFLLSDALDLSDAIVFNRTRWNLLKMLGRRTIVSLL